jgi:hypothetical protein
VRERVVRFGGRVDNIEEGGIASKLDVFIFDKLALN